MLIPLSQHAKNTLIGLASGACLRVSPFCHEHANEVKGWVLDIPDDSLAGRMPLNCSLFDGVSMALCECSEAEILQLLSNADQTRKRLGQAIHCIMQERACNEERRATWRRCRPTENGVPHSLYSALVARDGTVSLFSTQDCVALMDSEVWVPELSPEGFIGLYHHWHPVKKFLCLYVVCQSYLQGVPIIRRPGAGSRGHVHSGRRVSLGGKHSGCDRRLGATGPDSLQGSASS